MRATHWLAAGAAVVISSVSLPALAAVPQCGPTPGQAASGTPIRVGGIHGNAAPGDFSAATDAARAYFACVNAQGGIHGRPVAYQVENDQWQPELAAQAATKLIEDGKVIALVGNASFVEMSVNAPLYARHGIMAMASGCATSECFESANIVSTNQGPLASSVGAAQYAVEEKEAKHVSCIGLAIPSVGNWSCGAVEQYMAAKGLQGSRVLLNPAAPDVNSGLLEAMASGADTILVNLPAGLAIAFLKAAQEQDLGDDYVWVSSTPLYDKDVPAALGPYWNDRMFVNVELIPFTRGGPDATNFVQVMDAHARTEDPRDTFAQAGYLSARYFTEMLAAMDPAEIDDRAKVTAAIQAIQGKRSDMACGPYYVGQASRHMPNHAGVMVVVKGGAFEEVRDCYEYDSPYFAPIVAQEQALGMR